VKVGHLTKHQESPITVKLEQHLRDQLVCMIEEALDEMLRCERVEPGLLSLIAGADATIRALDRRATRCEDDRGARNAFDERDPPP
jgi:hypothetical protein